MRRPNGPAEQGPTRSLLRDLLVFQGVLLAGAARDLVLIPLTLGAAALDLAASKWQRPQFFTAMRELWRRSDRAIDRWSSAFEHDGEHAPTVDTLLLRIEQVVRDPQTGARRARALKRWAEMTLTRQRRRAHSDSAETPPPPPADGAQPDRAGR